MTRTGYFIRLALSVAIDVADFTIGRVPVVGSVGEGLGTVVLVGLWGWPGLAYVGELADVTEQFDGFLPLATLIALYVGVKEGHLFGKTPSVTNLPAKK